MFGHPQDPLRIEMKFLNDCCFNSGWLNITLRMGKSSSKFFRKAKRNSSQIQVIRFYGQNVLHFLLLCVRLNKYPFKGPLRHGKTEHLHSKYYLDVRSALLAPIYRVPGWM